MRAQKHLLIKLTLIEKYHHCAKDFAEIHS